ncbi:MAG: PEP-utilizing enzyme [Dehalococcoidia bacterium]
MSTTTSASLTAPDDHAAAGGRVHLVGTPSGGGTYFGVARLVLTLDDVDAVRPGEVVVAPALSPALAALLPLAGAIVAESGGPLSNGAIVARALGVPTVVAVADVTRVIATGDELLVDGMTGAVDRFRHGR